MINRIGSVVSLFTFLCVTQTGKRCHNMTDSMRGSPKHKPGVLCIPLSFFCIKVIRLLHTLTEGMQSPDATVSGHSMQRQRRLASQIDVHNGNRLSDKRIFLYR